MTTEIFKIPVKKTLVEILESCMVTPGEATPKHRLWLSIFDLVQGRTHTPQVYMYHLCPDSAAFSPHILKAALSKALVPFYPIAGRLRSDTSGRLEIDCTGDGVLFVTARADATLDELQSPAPSDELRRMLVPLADHTGALAMFQVTLNSRRNTQVFPFGVVVELATLTS
jgi:shikimate O-hydroxycinnamoyltransferase